MTKDEKVKSHTRWAMDITHVLNALGSESRFPVDIKQLSLKYSRQLFPDDPIIAVKGDSLPDFEGALYPIGEPRRGWAIIYNDLIKSNGRIRFTIAHEFGHYLTHRLSEKNIIECGTKVVSKRKGVGIEKEADEFAATILMPLDDFRKIIPAHKKPEFKEFSRCATRYGVSITAAILRWLEYTSRRSVLIESRDGGALWAWSSTSALKTGVYIKTTNQTYMLPRNSLVSTPQQICNEVKTRKHNAGVWFKESVEEHSVFYPHYDKSLTVLHLANTAPKGTFEYEDRFDSYDQFQRNSRR